MYTAIQQHTGKSKPKSKQQPTNHSEHTNLPTVLKQEFEQKSQCSFDDVTVHYHSKEPARLGALAYAKGSQIFIGPGQETHLRHELVHVAQQKQGRALGNSHLLEQEAEKGILQQLPATAHSQNMIQYYKLKTSDIDQLLQKMGMNTNSISEPDKDRICDLAGTTGFFSNLWHTIRFQNPLLDSASRILTICLESGNPNHAGEILNILETASHSGNMEPVINLLKGTTAKNQFIASGYDGNPKNNFPGSIPDILKTLTSSENPANDNQLKLLQLIGRLLKVSTPKGVLSVLEGANMNVKFPILSQLVADNPQPESREGQETFLKRLSLMTTNMEQVAQEFISYEGKDVPIKERYDIESTGSDPHKNGRQALFLIPKDGGPRILYKPRSLQTDQTVSGPQGIMATFTTNTSKDNKTNPSAVEPLPSMNFDAVKLQEGHSLRLESFVKRAGESEETALSWETACRFCRKLGQMEAIAKVCGLTDLHTDNIMFTEEGPIIIDAECSFLDYSGTGLDSALGPLSREHNSSSTDMAASVFYYVTPEGTIKKSSDIYSGSGNLTLQGEFHAGRDEMLNKLGTLRKDGISSVLDTSLADLDHIRLVPVATQDLAELLNSYLFEKEKQNQSKCTFLIESTALSALQSFLDEKWLFAGEQTILKLKPDAYSKTCQLIHAALEHGTIPAFYMDKSKTYTRKKMGKQPEIREIWDIRLDDTTIATTTWPGGLKKHILEKIMQNLHPTLSPHSTSSLQQIAQPQIPNTTASSTGKPKTKGEQRDWQMTLRVSEKIRSILYERSIAPDYNLAAVNSRAAVIVSNIDKMQRQAPDLDDTTWTPERTGVLNYKKVRSNIDACANFFLTTRMLAMRICAHAVKCNKLLSIEDTEQYIYQQSDIVTQCEQCPPSSDKVDAMFTAVLEKISKDLNLTFSRSS